MVVTIERQTGALVLDDGRVDRDLTRTALKAWPMAQASRWNDMRTGWMQVYLPEQLAGERKIGVNLSFDGERLASYALWISDPRYGTSWDDWTEEKQLAHRDAHDAWLVEMLGPGVRELRPWAPEGELAYSFAWGAAWSTFDPRSGGSRIGVRFRT